MGFKMRKIRGYCLLGIILFSSGCQLLDPGVRHRLGNLIKIGRDFKYGVKDYYTKEEIRQAREETIECLKRLKEIREEYGYKRNSN